MDRRSFLGYLGLGGLALTVPKPLEAIVAKIGPLAVPPIHVGVATLRGGFHLHGIGIAVPADARCDELADWKVHVVQRTPDLRAFNILFEKPAIDCVTRLTNVTATPGWMPRAQDQGFVYNVVKENTLQLWFSCVRRPKAVIPGIRALLKISPIDRLPMDTPLEAPLTLRRAQIERNQAVELGIVSERDPYETI